MPLTLDASVGTTTANAYLDQTAAQALLDGVPNATAWTSATSSARDQALVYATRLLDVLGFQGVRATVTQALQWPRGSVRDPDYGQDTGAIAGYMLNGWGVYLDRTTIPARVQRACAMLALEILRAGAGDVWGIDATANIQSKGVDVLRTDYVAVPLRRFGLRVYPSVWREVAPLLLAAEGMTVERA